MITVTGFTQAHIQSAINSAISNGMDTVFFPAGTYTMTTQINISWGSTYPLNKKGLKLLGDNAKIFLTGGGYTAFDFVCPSGYNNDTRIIIENFWFYTDNIDRPSVVKTEYANFVTIKDCVFHQVWEAIKCYNGAEVIIDSCNFLGCLTSVYFYRCRDSKILNSHAYGGNEGFIFEGVFDVGTDGGLIIDNCTANVHTQAGIRLTKAYTPILNNLVLENNSPNIKIESSQYGIISNCFVGPTQLIPSTTNYYYGIQFVKAAAPNNVNNDYWNLSNISTQRESRFENASFLEFSNITTFGVPKSISGGAMVFNDCHVANLSNLMFRALDSSLSHSLFVESNSDNFTIAGGSYESKQIKFDGSSRVGHNVINGPSVQFAILFVNGPMDSETGNYFIYDATSGQTINKLITAKKVLPALVLNQDIAVSSYQDFDVNTIIEQPADKFVVSGRLEIVGGVGGSFSAATVDIVRTASTTKATIINNTGNVGSFTISTPSNNIIRLQNTTGSYIVNTKIYLVDYNKLNFII